LAKQTESTKKNKKEKHISAIADFAAQKAVEEFEHSLDDGDIDDDGDEIDDETAPDDIPSESYEGNEQDVFMDAFAKAQKRNETAKFSIYRNGEMIAVKFYPYSWEQVQNEYGAGHYKVLARNSRGHYLAAQSQLIGVPTPEAKAPEVAPPQQNQGMNFLEMWTLMKDEKEKSERELKEQSHSAASSQSEMFKTMMMMSQQAQQQSQNMMMTILQQMNQNTVQMVQSMNDKVGLMFQNKKEEGIDPLKLQLLLQEAEKRAEERMRFMFEQIEAKSEAMAEEKAELLANQTEDGEKDSLTTQLIKGFIPLIANVGAALPQMAAAHQAPQHPNLPAPVTQTVPPVQRQEPPRPVAKPLAAAPVAQPKPLNPIPVAPASAPKKVEAPVNQTKQAILDISLPLIGNGLLKREKARDVADETIKTLEKIGVTRQNVNAEFKFDDVMALAKQYNIPSMANGWLKEFHEALSAPVDTAPSKSGEPSENSGGKPVGRSKGK